MKSKSSYFSSIIILLFFITSSCAVRKGNDGSGVFKLDSTKTWLYGNSSALFLIDDRGDLDIQKIQNLPDSAWTSAKHNTSFGLRPINIWFRLDVKNVSEEENWFVNVDNSQLTNVLFYYSNETENGFKMERSGSRTPISKISHPARFPMLPFTVARGKQIRIFVLFQSDNNTLTPLRFFPKSAHKRYESLMGFVSGAYYGAMFFLLFYNFVLFLSSRDKLFLFYCLYIFCISLFIFSSTKQWMPWYDFSAYEIVDHSIPIFSLLATLFATVFAKAYLFPEGEKSRLIILLKISIIFSGFSIPVFFAVPYIIAVYLGNFIPAFGIISVTIVAVRRFLEGFSGARYFLIAWSFLIVSVFLYISMNLGLFDYSSFISYSLMYATVFEGVFLSLGIGDRINRLKREREEARKDLLASQRKALEEEKRINESISRFVPNQFLEILKRRTILDVFRGDSVERDMTILFSDIRNFTRLSESRPAKEVFLLLNEYMERLGPSIAKHGGFIDKYIGDAIMALFPNGPSHAIYAALAMKEEVDKMSLTFIKDFKLEAGFGIHQGSVMLGTVGESNRLDTTVIGDNVNLASRLEGLTKNYGAPILVSDTVRRNVESESELDFREIDSVIVKGKTKPIVIYEVLNADPTLVRMAKNESYSTFFAGLHEYKSGNFSAALPLFETCLKICPDDQATQTYKKRTIDYIQNPPPENWTGLLQF